MIEYNKSDDNLILCPNPAGDVMYVSNALTDFELSIFDMADKCVLVNDQQVIFLSNLQTGIYLIWINDKTVKKLKTVKMFKK